MRLAALFSGGKDSTYALYLAKKRGNHIAYLATVISKNPDSYMYHTENVGTTMFLSSALGIQLSTKVSFGEKEKEVDDLRVLLKGLDVEGVVCGAIESEYQKKRVKMVCKELGKKLFTPLWHKDNEKYLRKMVKDKFVAMIVKVAADGFDESWLGRIIDDKCIDDLIKLKEKYRINIAFEGGEAETIVIDCPLYSRKLVITKSRKEWDEKTKSGRFVIEDAILADK